MKRFKTRAVNVGNIAVGGNNPIRIQSMTNTDTLDVIKTADQIMLLKDSGCEIVRLTVQGINHAKACEKIKNIIIKNNYDIPLVADIHFSKEAAIIAADFVDKVRINPGNYIQQAISENNLMEILEEGISPLVLKCKSQNKAIRIGVNHGSLSQRILNRFGNTPKGMVASAVEYTEACRRLNFENIIFSMKASNPIIMIEAYRLLVKTMLEKRWDYPLHLGVTEAGDEEDGVIKSAVGIGSLLLEGIGDTIRVSLTAAPEKEIKPAKQIIEIYDRYRLNECLLDPLMLGGNKEEEKVVDLPSKQILAILKEEEKLPNDSLEHVDLLLSNDLKITDLNHQIAKKREEKQIFLTNIDEDSLNKLKFTDATLIFFDPVNDRINKTKILYQWLKEHKKSSLIIAYFSYEGSKNQVAVEAGAELGSLLFDNVIDGICLNSTLSFKDRYELTFSVLQATRKKITKTEYISCPGCGRTLYDIERVAKNIKQKTNHLKGLKIAIMGCIVNGPGEMADADFGFIGSGKDRVNLYVGKKCVEENIDFSKAEDKLIEIIKKEGKWTDRS